MPLRQKKDPKIRKHRYCAAQKESDFQREDRHRPGMGSSSVHLRRGEALFSTPEYSRSPGNLRNFFSFCCAFHIKNEMVHNSQKLNKRRQTICKNTYRPDTPHPRPIARQSCSALLRRLLASAPFACGFLPASAVDPAGLYSGYSSATAPDFHRTSVSQTELFSPNIHLLKYKFKFQRNF